jgi:hypothetical protein
LSVLVLDVSNIETVERFSDFLHDARVDLKIP